MIGEFQVPVVGGVETAGAGGLAGCVLRRSYQWGLDVSGTWDGAGGVGGLLAIQRHGTGMTTTVTGTFLPCYDGNGNVTELVSWGSPGVVSARYEYSPFGETVVMEGDVIAGENPIRFSTKFADGETGLVNYGYRYYSPEIGRWVSRDPIGERGGMNLFGMVRNDVVGRWDILGLSDGEDKYCACTIPRVAQGADQLRKQAAEMKIALDGPGGNELREKYCGGGDGEGPVTATCKNNHNVLKAKSKIPPCWSCRIEVRTSTWWTKKFGGAGDWGDHAVVMCKATYSKAQGFLGNHEIILDITGG